MTIATTTLTIRSATASISTRKIASDVFPVGESTRRQVETCPTKVGLSLSGAQLIRSSALSERRASGRDRVDLRFGTLHDVRWQRRVLQVPRETLAIMNSPPEKIDHCFSFGRVFLVLVDKNVGVTGNRIRLRTRRVCYRHAQVVGRACGRRSRGRGAFIDSWSDEVPTRI